MPLLLLLPLVGGGGFLAGNWFSGGWFKWLIVLAVVVFAFVFAKKLGIIK